jgi:4-carboxymuconolactone decarboxylase
MTDTTPAAPRYRDLTPAELSDDQREVYDAIASGPRGSVPRIFHLYLHSPELCSRIQALGAFCRYGTSFSSALSETAILVVAHHFQAAYEWSVHEAEARKASVPDDVINAIRTSQPLPATTASDVELVHRFAATYLHRNAVDDALFAEARLAFGHKGVVELAGIVGYYSMLAMALRIFEVPPAE